MTITEVRDRIRSGNSTARAEVEAAIERAEKAVSYNALLSITKDRALVRADAIDIRLRSGEDIGELAGVPFIAKDNMLVFGTPTTAASKILENFEAPFQAECIERLEAAGAICIGKANLDAFAHGGSTENSAFGVTKNPVDATRVAGGSSGGSAASVALGIVPFALGSDTGGSIREPASFCGVVGFKPTYGTVSRYGVVAMASSTDVIGPITSTVDDAMLVTKIMAGKDEKDVTTLPENTMLRPAKAVKTYGIVKEWLEGVDSEVKIATEKAIEAIRAQGHEVREVSLPTLHYALAVYYVVVPAEVASNLARYDGIRYGQRVEAASLSDLYTDTRHAGFMPENKRRILIGNYVLSSGYYDAYYKQAAKVRTRIIEEFEKAFEQCDVLIGAVSPVPAFTIGERTDDPLQMYLADVMTVPASLAGLPAISVPITPTRAGLPIGLQIVGRRMADVDVLMAARDIEGVS